VLVKMPGKRLQHRVRFALSIDGHEQASVQTPDGQAHGPGALLDAVPAAPGVLAHESGNCFQLAQRLGFHRLDCIIVLQHRLQFALPAAQVPHGLRLVQPKVPLLNDLGSAGGLPGEGPGLQCQHQGVNRLPGWMQQQPGNIRSAWLVFEGRVPAFKYHFPEAQAPAQRILASIGVTAITDWWIRSHNSCHLNGVKPPFTNCEAWRHTS